MKPRALDALVALALCVVVAVTEQPRGEAWLLIPAGMVLSLTVAGRRRSAVAAVLVALAASAVMSSTNAPPLVVSPIVLALDYYCLGRVSAERGWSWVDAVLLAVPIAGIATDPHTASRGTPLVVDVLSVWAFFMAIPFVAGRIVAVREGLNRALQQQSERLRQEQRDSALRAVAEERSRIARELHDVVAHSVSVMVIQTAAARRVAVRDPAAAHAALRAVEGCGREALTDMRRMIGVLRRGDVDLLGGPSPGLAQLGKLADRAAASGFPVRISMQGEQRSLSAALDLLCFRVVQEALTNAIKHAGPAHGHVKVTFTADRLELEISDTGRGPRPDPAAVQDSGHGLIGMQERLTLYGGQLRTGRRRGGGFQVLASVPLTEEVPV